MVGSTPLASCNILLDPAGLLRAGSGLPVLGGLAPNSITAACLHLGLCWLVQSPIVGLTILTCRGHAQQHTCVDALHSAVQQALHLLKEGLCLPVGLPRCQANAIVLMGAELYPHKPGSSNQAHGAGH